jgi:hypothetical protein
LVKFNKRLFDMEPKPKPSDYELWLECRNCGTVYAKHDTKFEAVIEPLVQTRDSPFDKGKTKSIDMKKKVKRGCNHRIKTRDEIKDEDLKRALKDGAELISYSSSD